MDTPTDQAHDRVWSALHSVPASRSLSHVWQEPLA